MKKQMMWMAIILLMAFSVKAQTADSKYALGINATHSEYFGDLGSDVWQFSQGLRGGFGLSLGMYLNPSFD